MAQPLSIELPLPVDASSTRVVVYREKHQISITLPLKPITSLLQEVRRNARFCSDIQFVVATEETRQTRRHSVKERPRIRTRGYCKLKLFKSLNREQLQASVIIKCTASATSAVSPRAITFIATFFLESIPKLNLTRQSSSPRNVPDKAT